MTDTNKPRWYSAPGADGCLGAADVAPPRPLLVKRQPPTESRSGTIRPLAQGPVNMKGRLLAVVTQKIGTALWDDSNHSLVKPPCASQGFSVAAAP